MGSYCRQNGTTKFTIGVIGASHGVGATHFAIAIANFLALEMGRKVILTEFGDSVAFRDIPFESDKNIYGVSYYSNGSKKNILELINKDYDVLIFDFGSEWNEYQDEFLRCSRKIVVGSCCLWKRKSYHDFISQQQGKNMYMDWDFYVLFGKKKDKRELKKCYGIMAKSIPYFHDPYELEKEQFLFFQNVVKGL